MIHKPALVPIVEGDGEVDAVPILLRRFQERSQKWDFRIARPKNAHGKPNLLKPGGFERFLKLSLKESGCRAVLVLLDADKKCPLEIACELVSRAVAIGPPIHIAVVVAKQEYETWFLASLETLAGKTLKGRQAIVIGTKFENDYEGKRGVKEWLSSQMASGRTYKETFDQAPMTQYLDIDIVAQRCRSFKRMWNAFKQLQDALEQNLDPSITPKCE